MTGNDFVSFFLRTPLHVLMGKMMLITVTGLKTGKEYTTPVGYYQANDYLWILTSRDRTWWRNLKDGADVNLRLCGKDVSGFAEAILEEDAVAACVEEYLSNVPMAAKPLGVRMENHKPHPEDAARLAKERLFVKIKLNN